MRNEEKFTEWCEKEHIPSTVKKIVGAVLLELGFHNPFADGEEGVISVYNRGGYVIAYGKGFSMNYRTSSLLDGPDVDPKYVIKFIKGLGFSIENSDGDNGMDSATNYRDTWWTYDFIYKPSEVSFYEFEE